MENRYKIITVIFLAFVLLLTACKSEKKENLLSEEFSGKMSMYDEKLESLTDVYLANSNSMTDVERVKSDFMNIVDLVSEFGLLENEEMNSTEKEIYDSLNDLMFHTVLVNKMVIDTLDGKRVDDSRYKIRLEEYKDLYEEKQRVFEYYGID